MFVCTLRKGGLRRLAAVAICGVALAGAAFAVGAFRNEDSAVTAAAQSSPLKQEITGAQDVVSFFQGFGIEVDPTTAEVSTVTVPRKWDDSFKAFNEVIKESGLDLSRVKNKKVDKWVVLIPARTTETEKSYGVVLVYKNEPRGAYILQKPSGEVLPLQAATATNAPLALTDEEIAANIGFGADVPAPDASALTDPNAVPEADTDAAPVAASLDTPVDAGAVPAEADAGLAMDPNGFPTD
ncbi:MAG: DUF4830 domain-containing protein [Subdoligranulum sp.]|nr:DUF4830 domain-containing protein [Subdoligranulum sp.]MBD5102554.1 DUF4830 domain-containing protein [Subdoligranulum sp.]